MSSLRATACDHWVINIRVAGSIQRVLILGPLCCRSWLLTPTFFEKTPADHFWLHHHITPKLLLWEFSRSTGVGNGGIILKSSKFKGIFWLLWRLICIGNYRGMIPPPTNLWLTFAIPIVVRCSSSKSNWSRWLKPVKNLQYLVLINLSYWGGGD